MSEAPQFDPSVGQRHIIERPRLLKLLDETEAKIILLVAPAGYGKTTLARQWAARQERRVIALHGRRDASTALSFATALAGVAETADERCGSRLRERAKLDGPALSVSSAVHLLLHDLRPLLENLLVFIDGISDTVSADVGTVIDALAGAGSRVLATARELPAFATPRRQVYGEVAVIGASSLQMTDREVRRTLRALPLNTIAAVRDQAHGWPAVIGLAAMTRSSTTDALSTSLFDFFASELMTHLSSKTREGVTALAIFPRMDDRVFAILTKRSEAKALNAAATHGLLSPIPAQAGVEFHPLLRKYLLETMTARRRLSLAREAAETSLEAGAPHIAFELMREFGLGDLVPLVIEQALDTALDEGRLDRIAEWVAEATVASPHVDLAQAELSFRHGDFANAERLASRAAETLEWGDRQRSRAFAVAGRAAHLRDRSEEADHYFRHARQVAGTDDDTRAAAWGLFIVSTERETAGSDGTYEDVVALGDPTLRARADLHRARYSDIRLGLATGAAARRLAVKMGDPLARAAALNALANNLIVAGRYADALDIAKLQMRDASRFALDFVREHAQTNRASAAIGLRRLDEAAHALRAVPDLELLSPWLSSNFRCIAARLAIARGDLNAAWAVIHEPPLTEDLAAGMRGEHLAVAALVAAASDMRAPAMRLSEEAEAISRYVDVVVLVPLARALASRTNRQRAAQLELGRAGFLQTGAADALVTAYRARPVLLAQLCEDRSFVEPLKHVLERAHDIALGIRFGIKAGAPTAETTPSILTPREREVLTLVRAGLKNSEIAAALFISEVTVKAHLRQVFKKLGVRSRTQAALAADDAGS